MKFADIALFTRTPSYRVNIPLGSVLNTVVEYEQEYGLQLDPIFQRGHVWKEYQQTAYIEFLLRGGSSSRIILFNHPGWMKSFTGEFVLVDGKQRLEALRKFFSDELKVFGYYFAEFEDKVGSTNTMVFQINDLQSRREVLNWYLELNSGGTPHTEEELNWVKQLIEREE